ncbi:MAG: diacylglycerol kinase family protein [Fimbriimonadaceae bacterium]|nr:diacylglycerol kinase family protein [Chitinophagales bacterium]
MLRKELKRFADAWNGIVVFFKEGEHAKFHLFFSVFVIAAGFYFKITSAEWIAIIICIGLVLIAEAFNTAIEMLGDIVHKEIHPQMRKIKDLAAGAVLFAGIAAAAIGCIIFIPHILKL